MIIDIVLCVIVLAITLIQYHRGALMGLRGLLAFGGAGYLTYRFLPLVSDAVAERSGKPGKLVTTEMVTALVLFVLFVLVLYFLVGLVTGAIRSTGAARKADSLIGGIFGFLEGAVIVLAVSVILYGLNNYHLISSAPFASQVGASHFVSWSQGLAQRVIIL